jgi:dTDP-4-dehydrorhamnose reductase
MNNILLTGGSGRLGTELRKHFDLLYAPRSSEFDITKELPDRKFDLIIHAAAYTDVANAEGEGRNECQKINIEGTLNLLKKYSDTPFVFISSEYAIKPVNLYSATKTVGELLTYAYAKSHLIIRTLFKPRPYPFNVAFSDQYTRGDYIDIIGRLIAEEIKNWDKETAKTVHVGTKRKTMYQLAKQTRPDVIKNSIKDVKGVVIPADYR